MRILKIIGGSIAAMLIIIISQFVSQIIAGIVPYVWMSEIVQTLLYVGIALALGFVFTHCILKMKMRLSKSRLCVQPRSLLYHTTKRRNNLCLTMDFTGIRPTFWS